MKLLMTLIMASALLLAGCAREKVVLLPDADGKTGSLTITPKEGKPVVLDKPYTVATVGSSAVSTAQSDEAAIKKAYSETLSATPLPPAKFVLYFLVGSDELTADSKKELEKVLGEIKNRPVPDIVVVGHTDRVGSVPDNDRLSAARAQKIQAELVRQGIASDNIQATGRGEREPLVQTEDEVAEPKNRRVEIYVR